MLHLYGLDIGYQIGLIDASPLELSRADGYPSITYGLNRYIEQPIYMIDLKKFAQMDGQKTKITIPYEHFMTAAKDIIFIPYQGASYGNLNIYAQGYDIADIDSKTLTSAVYLPYVNSVLPYVEEGYNYFKMKENESFDSIMDNTCGEYYDASIYESFLNSDGSYNMFLSDIDFGEWQSEVTGDYGIVPEYLFYTLLPVHDSYDIANDLVHFAFNNMRDETTGLISGIWDNGSGKKVAVDRLSANSPLFLLFFDYLSNEEKTEMFQAITNHEIYSINGKYYYLPNGFENSRALIKLTDLTDVATTVDVFSDEKFPSGISAVLVEMLDKEIIDIEEAAIYSEAIANSLELIMQAQENNRHIYQIALSMLPLMKMVNVILKTQLANLILITTIIKQF